jgi:hypothetical protein
MFFFEIGSSPEEFSQRNGPCRYGTNGVKERRNRVESFLATMMKSLYMVLVEIGWIFLDRLEAPGPLDESGSWPFFFDKR